MDLNLKGKTVVVTGGSKGIGYAIAKEFLIEGANVFITGREVQALKKAQSELSQFGNLEVCPGDGTNEKDVEAAASYINGDALEVSGGQNIVLNPWFSEEKNY